MPIKLILNCLLYWPCYSLVDTRVVGAGAGGAGGPGPGPAWELGKATYSQRCTQLRIDAPNCFRIDAPNIRIDAPNIRIDAPNRFRIDAPNIRIDAPNIRIGAPNICIDAPSRSIDTHATPA